MGGGKEGSSNVGKDVKVFIILVFASFPLAQSLFGFDEFNALYPLHHFIPKLVFNAQSQRSPIHFRQRSLVHLIGEQTSRLERRFYSLRVIVLPTVQRVAVGIESHDFCFGSGFNDLDQSLERKSAPLRDSRPALDAMMHGEVFFLAECTKLLKRQFQRILHQTSNLQFEIPEAIRRKLLPLVGYWQLAIRPEEGRNVLLGIMFIGLEAA